MTSFGRRRWLQGAVAITGVSFLAGCDTASEDVDDGVCNQRERDDVKLATGDWFRSACVTALTADEDTTSCAVRATLADMADDRVTLVELDTELGTYVDEESFTRKLRVIDMISRECHALGMRCAAYYPVLQAFSPRGEETPGTMATDHPDWLQISIDGKPNVLVAADGLLTSGDEIAWLCPTSGYVDYFNARVVRLAGTAVDALWGDVPLLGDIGEWPCANASCNARFRAETGLDAPLAADWDDPRFVRWVAWRHRLIWTLEQRIVEAVKQVRPDFEVIMQTVTLDHGGTLRALDGGNADDGRVHRAWEILPVSSATGMRAATVDDWLSMAVMMKHASGASAPRAAWATCYALEEDDAEHTMGLAIAMGCSPFEAQLPEAGSRVARSFRKRMFGWLERHPQLLRSRPASRTAVLYSSVSRDVLDQGDGVSLYTSMNPADAEWWANDAADSALESEYVADYRGFCKLLFQNHVPFEIVTAPHVTRENIGRYGALLAPSVAAVATPVVDALLHWVESGGTLVLTGNEAGDRDENATRRKSPLLFDTFALSTGTPMWTDKNLGAGRVLHAQSRAGRAFFRGDDRALSRLAPILSRQIETNAPKNLFVDLRVADTGELVVAFANLVGLGAQGVGKFTPEPVTFRCAVDVGGRRVKSITLTSPNGEDKDASFTTEGVRVAFDVSVKAVAAAIVTFA